MTDYIGEYELTILQHDDPEALDWVDKLLELYSDSDDSLMHYGVGPEDNPPGRGSGRYPAGSGERAGQHAWDLYSRIRKYEKMVNPATGKLYTKSEIASIMGYYKVDHKGNVLTDKNGNPLPDTTKLAAEKHMAKNESRSELVARAAALSESIDPDTGKLYSRVKVAEILSKEYGKKFNESTIRNFENEQIQINNDKTNQAIAKLKDYLKDGGAIDVGAGAEYSLGVSRDRLNIALEVLKEEGYGVGTVKFDQLGRNDGAKTTNLVLYSPDMTYTDVVKNRGVIKSIDEPTGQALATVKGVQDPVRVSRDRIQIRFEEEGGKAKDGVVEIRAVKDANGNLVAASPDLSLGNAKYAQVRIAVEGDKYIKGMAIYNPDLPPGVDLLVNSNKSIKKGFDGALKDMERNKDGSINMDAPFKTSVFQSEYAPGKLSAINIVGDPYGTDKHEEGAWGDWSRNLPSQFLGKQSEALIKQQLALKVSEKQREYEEIKNLNNPTVKKQMLLDFADGCEAAASELKAAPFPGQSVNVILPLTTIRNNEIYAPNYDNGQTVALIRYPHTGPFEIPILKVNNGNREARGFLEDARGKAKDAVGISQATAEILSGADFDGDTVTVIPLTRKNSQGEFEKTLNIKGIGNGVARLPGFDGWDHQKEYKGTDDNGNMLPGVKRMTPKLKGKEMGVVSNLITDMVLKGCDDPRELERAVKYSMVVIDAEKHKLDYKRAEKEFNIKELKDKYQYDPRFPNRRGASTILSRASAEATVPQRKSPWTPDSKWYDPETGKLVTAIDPETGKKNYKPNPNLYYEERKPVKVAAPPGYTYTDANGKIKRSKWLKDEHGNDVYELNENGKPVTVGTGKQKMRLTKITRMEKVDDARELMSANPSSKELLYADFANKMKSMGNDARKEYLSVPSVKVDKEAKKKYAAEVKSLGDKLLEARKNAPRERDAQRIATEKYNAYKDSNPDATNEDLRKKRGQFLTAARNAVGAKKAKVVFTEKEWEAVNARAVAETTLVQLLKNADKDSYVSLATPRQSRISSSTASFIQSLLKAGWSKEQIADAGYATKATIDAAQKMNV